MSPKLQFQLHRPSPGKPIRSGITIPSRKALALLIQAAILEAVESPDASVSVNTAETLAQSLDAIYAVLRATGATHD